MIQLVQGQYYWYCTIWCKENIIGWSCTTWQFTKDFCRAPISVVSYPTRIQEPLRTGMLFATVRMTLLLSAVSWLRGIADSSTMQRPELVSLVFWWFWWILMILIWSLSARLERSLVSFRPFRCSKRFFDDRRVFTFNGTCNAEVWWQGEMKYRTLRSRKRALSRWQYRIFVEWVYQ